MDAVTATGARRAGSLALVGDFEAHLRSSELLPARSRIALALSGGLDSVALLDLLLNLRERWDWKLSAAHFDHRMRPESGAEAEWVGSLCRRKDLPCRTGRATVVPGNEAQARALRYEFLGRARSELGADWLATAHQADDQAETVLFRILRGSGLAGLAGIPARRRPRIVRPLLPFWRAEIEAYARARRLTYLADPSNLDQSIVRNRLRHQLIPVLEAGAAPDLRRKLVVLSELARRADRAVERVVSRSAESLVLDAGEGRIVVAHKRFRAYDVNVQAHLLRALAARVGPRPGRVGTRTALEFINNCCSGRQIDLAGQLVIRREFDRLHFERRARVPRAEDEELLLPAAQDGAGALVIGNVGWHVRWGVGPREKRPDDGAGIAWFDPSELRFPLTLRSWQAGDRIRLPAGSRKLKKVFVDRKVGLSERRSLPVLADGSGVLWVAGVVRCARAVSEGGSRALWVQLRRER